MPSFIPATGITLHLVGVCVNRIGVVDSIEIEFQCPSCGHDLKQTIALLKMKRQLIWPGCDIRINIDTDRLANAAKEIQKAIAKTPPGITIKFFR